jgi:hypothetical protein
MLVLQDLAPGKELDESEGMTAGKLMEMITAAQADGKGNEQQRIDR